VNCGHVLVLVVELPHGNHIRELVINVIIEEQETNTNLTQQNNPHEGLRIDVEQNGNVGDRLMEMSPSCMKNILFQHKEEFLLENESVHN
jgi:ABC-type phosphonate transport system ATPase subunit